MSATCPFCDRQFANAQAVRAQLKGCAAYQERKAQTLPQISVSWAANRQEKRSANINRTKTRQGKR